VEPDQERKRTGKESGGAQIGLGYFCRSKEVIRRGRGRRQVPFFLRGQRGKKIGTERLRSARSGDESPKRRMETYADGESRKETRMQGCLRGKRGTIRARSQGKGEGAIKPKRSDSFLEGGKTDWEVWE